MESAWNQSLWVLFLDFCTWSTFSACSLGVSFFSGGGFFGLAGDLSYFDSPFLGDRLCDPLVISALCSFKVQPVTFIRSGCRSLLELEKRPLLSLKSAWKTGFPQFLSPLLGCSDSWSATHYGSYSIEAIGGTLLHFALVPLWWSFRHDRWLGHGCGSSQHTSLTSAVLSPFSPCFSPPWAWSWGSPLWFSSKLAISLPDGQWLGPLAERFPYLITHQ